MTTERYRDASSEGLANVERQGVVIDVPIRQQ